MKDRTWSKLLGTAGLALALAPPAFLCIPAVDAQVTTRPSAPATQRRGTPSTTQPVSSLSSPARSPNRAAPATQPAGIPRTAGPATRPHGEVNSAAAAAPWAGVRLGVAIDVQPAGRDPATQPLAGMVRPAGLMVINVVRDGPADKAGLRPFDFIVRVAGESQPADLAVFNKRIRALQVGDVVPLTIERAGKERDVNLTLAGYPTGQVLTFKYPADPDPANGKTRPDEIYIKRDATLTRIELASPGNVRILDQLPPDLRQHFLDRLRQQLQPDLRLKATQVFDGLTIAVLEDRQGRITVTRRGTDDSGQRRDERRDYAGVPALNQNDPQAFTLYQKAQSIQAPAPGLPPGLTAAGVGVGAAGAGGDPALESTTAASVFHSAGPVVTSEFTVSRNGEIEVRVQQGGGAVKQTFTNEEEFRKAAPRLYEQYRALRKAIE